MTATKKILWHSGKINNNYYSHLFVFVISSVSKKHTRSAVGQRQPVDRSRPPLLPLRVLLPRFQVFLQRRVTIRLVLDNRVSQRGGSFGKQRVYLVLTFLFRQLDTDDSEIDWQAVKPQGRTTLVSWVTTWTKAAWQPAIPTLEVLIFDLHVLGSMCFSTLTCPH